VVPSAIPTVSAPHFPPTPTVTFRVRALRSRKGIVVGRVSCAVTCSIALTVSDGRRTYRRALRGSGPISLALTAKPRRGTLRVSVSVDGRAPVRGRVLLGGLGPAGGERPERVAELGVDLRVHAHPHVRRAHLDLVGRWVQASVPIDDPVGA